MQTRGDMTNSTNSRRIGLMAQRRRSALLLAVPVLALSLFLVGCPKGLAPPAPPGLLPPAPPAPSAAPPPRPSPARTRSRAAPPPPPTQRPPPSEHGAPA